MVPEHPAAHQILLSVFPTTPGGPGNNPSVQYVVAVCGPSPFAGTLLMGGAARMYAPTQTDVARLETHPVSPQSLSGNVFDISSGEEAQLGPVDAFQIQMPSVSECPPGLADSDPPNMVGTPVTFTGQLRHPTRQQFNFLGLHGPREAQSWPLVGRLPSPVHERSLGNFIIDGLPGQWARPFPLIVHVSVGAVTSRAAIESSRPQLSDTQQLTWRTRAPIAPSARLVNLDDQARWQQWLIAVSVGLGIGASLLAAMVLEVATKRVQSQQEASRTVVFDTLARPGPDDSGRAPRSETSVDSPLAEQRGAETAVTAKRTHAIGTALAVLAAFIIGRATKR